MNPFFGSPASPVYLKSLEAGKSLTLCGYGFLQATHKDDAQSSRLLCKKIT